MAPLWGKSLPRWDGGDYDQKVPPGPKASLRAEKRPLLPNTESDPHTLVLDQVRGSTGSDAKMDPGPTGLTGLLKNFQDPYILCWDVRNTVDIVYKLSLNETQHFNETQASID
ncbi:hypothetical protein QJS10_CPB13g01279 [Acorus calamus]|uniref:Uncharacterized protein n=1 Tax=Acorus calamus TaxID=4465 RepID=A0AAV9DFS0_ACOCL|nr:hypothetical protein QJS10_CPB13g01279 [Acorus calamus]